MTILPSFHNSSYQPHNYLLSILQRITTPSNPLNNNNNTTSSTETSTETSPLADNGSVAVIISGITIVTVVIIFVILAHMVINRFIRRRRLQPIQNLSHNQISPLQLNQNHSAIEYVARDSAARLFEDVAPDPRSHPSEGASIREIDTAAPLFRIPHDNIEKDQQKVSNEADESEEEEEEEEEDDDDDDRSVCAICLDTLLPAQRARMLPCKHVYHDPCAVVWLVKANRCPVCSQQVVERPPPPPPVRIQHMSGRQGGFAEENQTLERMSQRDVQPPLLVVRSRSRSGSRESGWRWFRRAFRNGDG